jgi:hypothetical protein
MEENKTGNSPEVGHNDKPLSSGNALTPNSELPLSNPTMDEPIAASETIPEVQQTIT